MKDDHSPQSHERKETSAFALGPHIYLRIPTKMVPVWEYLRNRAIGLWLLNVGGLAVVNWVQCTPVFCGSLLRVPVFPAQVYLSPFSVLWGQFDSIFAVELSNGYAAQPDRRAIDNPGSAK